MLTRPTLEKPSSGLGTWLPQVLVLFGPPFHQTRFPAIRSVTDPFFAYLPEQQLALPQPFRHGRPGQLAARGVHGLLAGRKAHRTRMHFLHKRRLARDLANQVVTEEVNPDFFVDHER